MKLTNEEIKVAWVCFQFCDGVHIVFTYLASHNSSFASLFSLPSNIEVVILKMESNDGPFKTPLWESLQKYTKHIAELKEEINEVKKSAERIRREMDTVSLLCL